MNKVDKRIIFVRHGESTENIAEKEGKSYDNNNIVLTDKGKIQAIKTGQYLYEIFGKFDKVYTSPATRCLQTTDIIINKISHKKIPEICNLLIEVGYESNKLAGLSKDKKDKILDDIQLSNLPKDKLFSKIKTFKQLTKKLKQTNNPYDRLKITKMWLEVEKLHLDINPNTYQVANNYNKFIKKLKKSNDKNILVISHSGSINILQKIICNIDIMNMDLNIQNKDIKSNFGNCCILCLSLEKNKYSIVSPANTSHLNYTN